MSSSSNKNSSSIPGLSNFQLKIIAVITMVVDHCGLIVFNLTGSESLYYACRFIGRISFPLFCFLLVEGLIYTKSRIKHLALLTMFAVISEPIYDLFSCASKKSFVLFHSNFINFGKQSIMCSLLIGFLAIWLIDILNKKMSGDDKSMFIILLKYFLMMLVTLVACIVAHYTKSDYGYKAIILIVGFYFTRFHIFEQGLLMFFANIVLVNIVPFNGTIVYTTKPQMQWLAMLSLIPIYFYNGTAGSKKMKYAFYIFYPAHLLVLALIKYWTVR